MYEKCFLTKEEARECAKLVHGRIFTFLSTDEHGEVITIYAVRYKQLF
jgi:hypothetical protein